MNRDVDLVNLRELQAICGGGTNTTNNSSNSSEGSQKIQYKVRFTWHPSGKDPHLNQLKMGIKAPEVLTLCIGAQVMLLKNLETSVGLVNGTRGRVVGFCVDEEDSEDIVLTKDMSNVPAYPRVEFYCMVSGKVSIVSRVLKRESWDSMEGDKVMASIMQIPLVLAWAISIHKVSSGVCVCICMVLFVYVYGDMCVYMYGAVCMCCMCVVIYVYPYLYISLVCIHIHTYTYTHIRIHI